MHIMYLHFGQIQTIRHKIFDQSVLFQFQQTIKHSQYQITLPNILFDFLCTKEQHKYIWIKQSNIKILVI